MKNMVEEHLICSLCLVTATLPAVAGLKPTFASGDQCHSTCGRTHAPRQQQGNGDSMLWMPKVEALQGGVFLAASVGTNKSVQRKHREKGSEATPESFGRRVLAAADFHNPRPCSPNVDKATPACSGRVTFTFQNPSRRQSIHLRGHEWPPIRHGKRRMEFARRS